jgi:hypothetical protein
VDRHEGRRRGQIEGYLYYEVDTTNGPFKLAYPAGGGRARPSASLSATSRPLADQVSEIHFAAPGDSSWPLLFETPQNLRPGPEIGLMADTGNLGVGMMLRIVDVKPALEALPVAPSSRGEIVLEVEDDVIPQNARSYRVSARDGRLSAPRRPPTARAAARSRDSAVCRSARRGDDHSDRAAEIGPWSRPTARPRSSSPGSHRPAYLHHFNAF